MKTSSRSRRTLNWLGICLFVSMALIPWAFASAQSEGRLIIRRAPDLGRNVIVQLAIDGHQVTYLTYGHNYDERIAPGRHVITVTPTPNAKWKTGTPMTLEVRSGGIYTFTARNDNSGHLTLIARS